MKKTINIAIYTSDFSWAGGVDFIYGLIKGLLAQKRRECRIFILIHDPSIPVKKSTARRLADQLRSGLNIAKNPAAIFQSKSAKTTQETAASDGFSITTGLRELLSGEPVQLEYYNDNCYIGKLELLKKISADVILPVLNNKFEFNFPYPWVGYLFDFVYRYYSELYTKDFCLETDIKYATSLLHAPAVIVNSRATYDDIYKFYPFAKAKVFALPFAPFTNETLYDEAVVKSDVLERYKIPGNYYMISNQFWLHKSHETAFEALKIMIDKGHDVYLVCTGRMTDLTGNNNRRDQLLGFVKERGLEDRILFLGHLSKVDQLALMLRCKSVIQPTLFEGGPGGGSVYMALANNIHAIVSDIPVNREIQENSLVTFFRARDSNDLVTQMEKALNHSTDFLPYSEIHRQNNTSLENLGSTLIDSVEYTIENYQK